MNKIWKRIVTVVFVFTFLVSYIFNVNAYAETARTREEALNWVRSQEGKFLDFDRQYGAQCVDFLSFYYQYLGKPILWGNANAFTWSNPPAGWTKYPNTGNFVPQPGDVAATTAGPYGHVGIVLSANNDTVEIMDQNRSGKNSYGNYDPVKKGIFRKAYFTHYIRPDFKTDSMPPLPSTTTELYNGWYIIKTLGSSNMVVTADSNMGVEAPNVYISKNNLADNQLWYFEALGDGSYKIVNKLRNKVLDVKDILKDNETNILLWNWTGTDNQRWYLTKNSDGTFGLIAKHSHLRFDVEYEWLDKEGANIWQIVPNGSRAQKFIIENPFKPASTTTSVSNGKYIIKTVGNADMAVTADDNMSVEAPNVYISKANGQKNQVWNFEVLEDGTYKITNELRNKVFDVKDISKNLGANVLLWYWTGTDNQRWYLVKNADGTFGMMAKHSGFMFDVENEWIEKNGANIWQIIPNGSKAQKFRLEKLNEDSKKTDENAKKQEDVKKQEASYIVRFLDSSGTLIKKESVKKNASAAAPVAPLKAGYNFKGWDKNYTNITGNTDIYAVYEKITENSVENSAENNNEPVENQNKYDITSGNAEIRLVPVLKKYKNNKYALNISKDDVYKALDELEDEGVITVEAKDVPENFKKLTVNLTLKSIEDMLDEELETLKLELPIGTVTISGDALEDICNKAAGKKIEIQIKRAVRKDVSKKTWSKLKGAKLYFLDIKSGHKTLPNLNKDDISADGIFVNMKKNELRKHLIYIKK